MHRRRRKLRRTLVAVVASAVALGGLTATASAAGTDTQPAVSAPLPAELERIRAAEAAALYGNPAERPFDERRTSIVSLGDSEISGEGIGTYERGTNGPDNWCHRSPDAAIHRTGIATDTTYNLACSGARTGHIVIGGSKQHDDELVQSDHLAIKARNTTVRMVLLVVGANDDLRFGSVMTDCVKHWFLFKGTCAPTYAPGWQARVDGLRPKVEKAARDLRTVMRDAGYADTDYRLVVMGYPSPVGPDVYDNPGFKGKLLGGCTGHDSDAAWGRDQAVPAFERGIREAARGAGAVYLDNSRLFHGHEVCMDNAWARGLYIDLLNPFPPNANSLRQSFHPNRRGHAAFAACLTQLYAVDWREASCADPASTSRPVLYEGAWDDMFRPLRNRATGTCVDVGRSKTANGSDVGGWDCHGGRNQEWWYDGERGSLHSALTHDRCLDVPRSDYSAGASPHLWNCHGGPNQRFVLRGETIRPRQAQHLCLSLASAGGDLRLRPCDGSAQQRFA
ncbi:ricin-type beta-trefoil lectin domain protein [Streptomyces sp. HNM0645]|uniref:ricin-type beta-trefoil lectin domain protein n=1 Tax=Streptomyces sp. HNM0645 TaxID=2782343 RepID=UPI0024B7A1A3|nr:ricin-type beta-trefoil lectin domain protein [Streptomyces sp. HNM0645]MDI9883065.1 ricin-type beta-trefoil lectin domain protein [Streptomyces sp. HNM0645]